MPPTTNSAGCSGSGQAAGCCASTGSGWPTGSRCRSNASHLSAQRFPGLRRNLDRHPSLYEALATDYGVEIAEAQETIETGLADPKDAPLLRVNVGMPLLLLSRHSFDTAGTPVEWAQSRYRGDRYKLMTRLHRGTKPKELT